MPLENQACSGPGAVPLCSNGSLQPCTRACRSQSRNILPPAVVFRWPASCSRRQTGDGLPRFSSFESLVYLVPNETRPSHPASPYPRFGTVSLARSGAWFPGSGSGSTRPDVPPLPSSAHRSLVRLIFPLRSVMPLRPDLPSYLALKACAAMLTGLWTAMEHRTV